MSAAYVNPLHFFQMFPSFPFFLDLVSSALQIYCAQLWEKAAIDVHEVLKDRFNLCTLVLLSSMKDFIELNIPEVLFRSPLLGG